MTLEPSYILQKLYSTDDQVRGHNLSMEAAREVYREYIRFVSHHARGGSLLDVGCGVGWSTFLFAECGYEAFGIDLNPKAFEPPGRDGLVLCEGSAMELQYRSDSFDVVVSCQVLEHVPDPKKMLDEMVRVAKPGGTIGIVGPNLLGLNNSFQAITKHIWKVRPICNILIRTSDLPKHPLGNTLPEICMMFPLTICRIVWKSFLKQPHFTMRVPDTRPPFYSDNDACYLCNPIDLNAYFRSRGCKVIRDWALDRPRWTRMLAGGTWIVARKP